MSLGITPASADLYGSVRELCEQKLSATSIYRLLAEQGHGLFADETFADLFEDIGRRSVPPRIVATVMVDDAERQIEGVGNGPIAAFVDALSRECDIELEVLDYHEDAVGAGADAQAAAYVQIRGNGAGTLYGVGIDGDIVTASLKAVASAATRATSLGVAAK